MEEFGQYYLKFLKEFFGNVWEFITVRLHTWGKIFTDDIPTYFAQLTESAASFKFFSWLMWGFVTIVNLTLVFFLVYRLVQLIRRYIMYRGKSVEKDKLLEELALSKIQIAELTKEKTRLYEMQIGRPTGGSMAPQSSGGGAAANDFSDSRFTKLKAIDQRYDEGAFVTQMDDIDKQTLAELTERFRNYAASQLKLYYTHHAVRCYFAGMATTKVMILEGISGTGKTSFPYAMSRFFNNTAEIVSVQPSWRDRADLLGYFNEFNKQFNETDFLAAIYEACYRDEPRFIVLDEMNLARVEYYFADFLSIMEMPDVSEWQVEVVQRPNTGDPRLLHDGKLLIPQNIWFIGTSNQDDSTFTITDKVYDRSVSIDLNQRGQYFDAPLTDNVNMNAEYLSRLFFDARQDYRISDIGKQAIGEIDEYITEKLKVAFGNRIKRQIDTFVPVYVACGGTEVEAIDFILMSKVFRKFTMLNIPFLVKELNGLIALLDKLYGKNVMEHSTEYIKQLIKMA